MIISLSQAGISYLIKVQCSECVIISVFMVIQTLSTLELFSGIVFVMVVLWHGRLLTIAWIGTNRNSEYLSKNAVEETLALRNKALE